MGSSIDEAAKLPQGIRMVARILLGCLGVVIVVLVGVFADRWVNACAMDDTLSESRLEDN